MNIFIFVTKDEGGDQLAGTETKYTKKTTTQSRHSVLT